MRNRTTTGHDRPLIYLVDDDEGVRDSLRLLIGTQGWRVHAFASCEQFIAAMTRGTEASACLVLDLHMPGMSGFELLQFLRDKRSTMPTIILTGKPRAPLAMRARKSGARSVIHKPVDADRLIATIRHLLDSGD